MSNVRQIRGASIAAAGGLVQVEFNRWRVPGTSHHFYHVTGYYRQVSCDCPDFKKHHHQCKHIFAVVTELAFRLS